jgi:hypothetical protein
MLLIGTEHEGNVVRITDYYVPEQKVTSASVKMNECMDLETVQKLGIVATIHSHASMKVFFSGTDYTETNTSFIKNHIVVNNKQEFIATKAIELPCGMKRFIDAVVTRDLPAIDTATEVKGMDKIEKYTYTPPAYDSKRKYTSLLEREQWDSDFLAESYIDTHKTRKRHAFDMLDSKWEGHNAE